MPCMPGRAGARTTPLRAVPLQRVHHVRDEKGSLWLVSCLARLRRSRINSEVRWGRAMLRLVRCNQRWRKFSPSGKVRAKTRGKLNPSGCVQGWMGTQHTSK